MSPANGPSRFSSKTSAATSRRSNRTPGSSQLRSSKRSSRCSWRPGRLGQPCRTQLARVPDALGLHGRRGHLRPPAATAFSGQPELDAGRLHRSRRGERRIRATPQPLGAGRHRRPGGLGETMPDGARSRTALASDLFSTPVVHFLVAAFLAEGIDEFIAHLTALEAALGLRADKARELTMGSARPGPARRAPAPRAPMDGSSISAASTSTAAHDRHQRRKSQRRPAPGPTGRRRSGQPSQAPIADRVGLSAGHWRRADRRRPSPSAGEESAGPLGTGGLDLGPQGRSSPCRSP